MGCQNQQLKPSMTVKACVYNRNATWRGLGDSADLRKPGFRSVINRILVRQIKGGRTLRYPKEVKGGLKSSLPSESLPQIYSWWLWPIEQIVPSKVAFPTSLYFCSLPFQSPNHLHSHATSKQIRCGSQDASPLLSLAITAPKNLPIMNFHLKAAQNSLLANHKMQLNLRKNSRPSLLSSPAERMLLSKYMFNPDANSKHRIIFNNSSTVPAGL